METKNVVLVENEKEVANNKVNKVDAKKAKAQAKANSTIKLSVDSIFKSLNEKTNGLLKTSLGKKTEIYVESLFAELNEKQKKAYRKKLRNKLLGFGVSAAVAVLCGGICLGLIRFAKQKKKRNKMN